MSGPSFPVTPHRCFRVADFERIRADFLARGGSLQGETTEIAEGIAKGLRGLYMRHPNGIMIEIVETRT